MVMGINVGLRISDLHTLLVRDVRNKSHIVIREKKASKKKRFPINAELREIRLYQGQEGRSAIISIQEDR